MHMRIHGVAICMHNKQTHAKRGEGQVTRAEGVWLMFMNHSRDFGILHNLLERKSVSEEDAYRESTAKGKEKI